MEGRATYNFRDYGFETIAHLNEKFEIVPASLTGEEAFLFFFARDDVANGRWALFNLHIFNKRTGSLEDFAHGLGESVRDVPLAPVKAFPGIEAIGYSRTISMADLFKGGEPVISFVGGEPGWIVRDSHYYFMHQHRHCYTGVLHHPGQERRYDSLRHEIFNEVRFVD